MRRRPGFHPQAIAARCLRLITFQPDPVCGYVDSPPDSDCLRRAGNGVPALLYACLLDRTEDVRIVVPANAVKVESVLQTA